MPPFYGTNLTDRLKPAAILLGLSDRPLAGMVVRGPGSRIPEAGAGPRPRPARRSSPPSPTAGGGRSRCPPTRRSPGGPTSRRPGARGTTAISASSGGTSSPGSPRTRRARTEEPRDRDRQDHLPAGPADPRHGQGLRREARSDRPLPPGRPPGPADSSNPKAPTPPPLVPDSPLTSRAESRDFAAALAIPPAESIRGANGSSLQPARSRSSPSTGSGWSPRRAWTSRSSTTRRSSATPGPTRTRLASLASGAGARS